MKYGELNLGQIEAIVNKLGGMEGVKRLLRDELSVSEPTRSWREENGVIYFSVKSDGTTGPEWERWYDENGYNLSDEARFILNSPDFKATNGMTIEVAILKGILFEDNDRITKNIRAEADKRKLSKPNAEVICLIRKNFSDKEIEAMGLWWIIAMHEPINDSDGDPDLLIASRIVVGRWLLAYDGRPGGRWSRDSGFAFAASQVGP